MFHVIEDFIDEEKVAELLRVYNHARRMDGRETAGYAAREVKRCSILQPDDVRTQALLVTRFLNQSEELKAMAYPASSTLPMFVEYSAGDAYGYHEDSPIAQHVRTDISFTLALNDDHDSGLELMTGEYPSGMSDLAPTTVLLRPPAGSLILYPSGTPHRVPEVKEGCRRVIVGWFQSRVRNADDRQTLYELWKLQEVLSGRDLDELNRARARLMRRWFE